MVRDNNFPPRFLLFFYYKRKEKKHTEDLLNISIYFVVRNYSKIESSDILENGKLFILYTHIHTIQATITRCWRETLSKHFDLLLHR